MNYQTNPLDKLINELSKLPGVGEKSAARIAYFILKSSKDYGNKLSFLINEVKTKILLCSSCFNFTSNTLCEVCSDTRRDKKTICVIENSIDQKIIEKTGSFNGIYHVLHGLLSPLNGIGPSDLKIDELQNRIINEKIEEIILAISATVEGEATSLYIKDNLGEFDVKITKLASGIPVGSNLEFIDSLTLQKAIEQRSTLK